MARYNFPQSKKAGLPPGTFIHVGEKKVEQTDIQLFSYNVSSLREVSSPSAEEILNWVDPSTICWINVSGLFQTDIIQKTGEHFGIHPLIIEDILDTNHRPKIEDHGNYLFTSIKMLYPD